MKRSIIFGRIMAAAAAVGALSAGIWGFSLAAPGLGWLCAKTAALTLGQPLDERDEPQEGILLLTGVPVSEGCKAMSDAEAPSVSEPDSSNDSSSEPGEAAEQQGAHEFPSSKPSAEVLGAIPYPESLERSDGPIEKMNYGRHTGTQFFDLAGGGQVRNSTSLPNSALLAESAKPIDFVTNVTESEPLVLIYHTHTTESFEPCDHDSYDATYKSKTTDPEKNMTAVGNRICAELDKAGIPYVHDTLVHDHPSYNAAYDSSRESVLELLEKYPSIRIVLDIHRDGIQRQDGTRIAPVAEIDGKEAAQIMIISGCDDGTMGMPEYIKNFHFACALQQKLETLYSGLTRPILFDYRHYNQDLTTGSLLIEVGSHGNSLDQALYSGELIGKGLCELIKENAMDE